MLAITYWDENVVTLMDSSGNMVDQVLISDSQNLNAKYWLDATHIVLMDWESTITNPYPSIIVDINEHSWIVFSPEFEDINRNPDGNGYSWYPTGGLTRLSINPQQTYLVYPSYKYTETLSELVLWDLEKKRDIARLQIDVSNTFPWWSPDGTRFITGGFWWSKEQNSELPDVGGLELVSVNVDGEIKRLSYYTTKYTAYTYDYIWSPDGQKIAFWMDILDPNNSRSRSYHGPYELATLDINTGEVINYCIRGLDYPVWSPDGQQLAIRASIIDNQAYEDVRDVYIVDLEEKIAVRSTDSGHQTVTGWMVYDP